MLLWDISEKMEKLLATPHHLMIHQIIMIRTNKTLKKSNATYHQKKQLAKMKVSSLVISPEKIV